MSSKRVPRMSPATAVALVALFVALGGTSYAALSLPKNSVGTKQLKKHAVTTAKIANGAVTGSKLNLTGVVAPNATHASRADSATSATSASSATSATTVDGQRIMGFHQTVATGTAAQQTVFSYNGLTLTLSCSSGEPIVQATSNETGAFMRGSVVSFGSTGPAGTSSALGGTPVTVFPASDSRGSFDLHFLRLNGQRVDVNAAVDDTSTINGFNGCLLEGTAIAG